MTIKALAQAMDISVGRLFFPYFFIKYRLSYWNLDHIYDCLIHIKNGDRYSSDDQGLLYKKQEIKYVKMKNNIFRNRWF